MLSFLKNYFSTLVFIWVSYIFYTNNTYCIWFFNESYSLNSINFKLTTFQFFLFLSIFYSLILYLYYFYYTEIKSKACILFECLFTFNFRSIGKEEIQAFLTLTVKFFFVPLMLNWLLWHIFWMINNIDNFIKIYSEITFLQLFNSNLYWTLFQIILFADVLFFTLGYIIELPCLKNKILSVDSTILWWAVCLICYPPFNSFMTKIIWWYSSDFPQFSNTTVHIILNSILLILMAIYALASISLNFKASNLTNRWVISSWIYKIVRHPAYISKNLAWWVGWIPVLITSFNNSNLVFISALISLIGWSLIYYMRAITEEKHLLMLNNGYREYMKKVKYRFIPGLI